MPDPLQHKARDNEAHRYQDARRVCEDQTRLGLNHTAMSPREPVTHGIVRSVAVELAESHAYERRNAFFQTTTVAYGEATSDRIEIIFNKSWFRLNSSKDLWSCREKTISPLDCP
jgi:hypothetical protein